MSRMSIEKTEAIKAAILPERKFHQELFNIIGEPLAHFVPRLCHNVQGVKCFTFRTIDFPKESQDIFTEKITNKGLSEDPTRTLYRWQYDPYKIDKYKTTTYSNGEELLCIPLSEFIVYEYPIENIIKKFGLTIPKVVEVKKNIKTPKKEIKISGKTMTEIKNSLVSDLSMVELCEYITYRIKNFVNNEYK